MKFAERRMTVEINIKGDPKEIATLVLEIQGRRNVDVSQLAINTNKLAESLKASLDWMK